ncbi:MAG: ATP-binding cassette domain-containing protein [Candidatus Marinimicrobia bacterium]|nr:ATP-binding cassette domain-containing protein [Candidatus Neomarinimicrobiota bacterium]
MIDVQELTHVYKSGKGVFDLNFSIHEGEVFGYLGPNGAGKTTTIRNIMGFVNAWSGRVTIRGLDCRNDAAELQKIIGYLPGEIAFFDNMKGPEFLKFVGDMHRMKDTRIRDRLIDRFDLDVSGSIRKMSKGMKQKLGIVAAFMHDPEVYILDEPTGGLDPFMQNLFMELIKEERSRGKTVMMSSHLIEEVQRSCDRAGIIREGRLAAIEDIRSLNEMKSREFIVTLNTKSDAEKLLGTALETKKLDAKRVLVRVGRNFNDFIRTLSAGLLILATCILFAAAVYVFDKRSLNV